MGRQAIKMLVSPPPRRKVARTAVVDVEPAQVLENSASVEEADGCGELEPIDNSCLQRNFRNNNVSYDITADYGCCGSTSSWYSSFC